MIADNRDLCESCFEEISHDTALCSACGHNQGIRKADCNLPIGTILMGRFVIGRVLGKGGFGVTYLAYDLKGGRKVAIKEYMPDALSWRTPGSTAVSTYSGEKEESFKLGSEKFYDEAKTISRFNGHPNIINVFEFFYENNTAYFVMEYIEGVDVKTHVARRGGRLSEEEAVRLTLPVMDALIVVHSVGILHRDISPDNIYITKNNEVKLLDFGAARQVLGDMSKSLSVVLKPGFAPIEQYQSRGNQGQWTDVYALGATLYYCLTSHVPEAAMDRIDTDGLKAPEEFGISVSSQLWNVINRSLSLRAANRYQTMSEFKQAILLHNEYGNENIPYEKAEPDKTFTDGGGRESEKQKGLLIPVSVACSILIAITAIGITAWSLSNRNVSTGKNLAYSMQTAKTVSTVSESNEGDNGSTEKPSSTQQVEVETQIQVVAEDGTEKPVSEKNQGETVNDMDYLYSSSLFSVKCKYSGEWKDNKPNGSGSLVLLEDFSKYYWGKGSKFTGNFTDGILNGPGTCEYADSCFYEGNYENGIMSGEGTCTFTNGDVYSGQWKNDKMEGQGTYTSKNGEVYEGQWVKSKREGQGTKTYKDGSRYAGQWKNGKRSGQGILYDSSGNVLHEGNWEKDIYIG
jgi:serine/threonine protein kinase